MPAKRDPATGKVIIQGSERGVRFHKILPATTKTSDANKWERNKRAEIIGVVEFGRTPNYTIGEGIMRYLKEYNGKARPDHHAKALKPYVIGKNLSDIPDVAERIRMAKGLTNSTKNRRIAILKRVAKLAYTRWKWLKSPVHDKIEMLPENPARNVYLSRSELAKLLRAIPDRDMRRACLILAFTGLRKGELLGLKPANISGNVIRLATTKNGKPRHVPVLYSVAFALKRLPFRFDPTSLSHAVSRASGKKVRVHDLRHTTASLLVQAGVPLYTVGAILGNQSAVKRYAHLDMQSMESAISKLKPSRILPTKQTDDDEKAA